MKRNTQRYNFILKLLIFANEIKEDEALWDAWLRCVAGSLYMEYLYPNEVTLCNKSVYKYMDEFELVKTSEQAIQWANKTYRTDHKLRFAVETLDSIEEVRVYLAKVSEKYEKHIHLYNLLYLSDSERVFRAYSLSI